MRFAASMLLSLVMTGCGGGRVFDVTPDAAGPAPSRPPASPPAESLETFMAKVRKLSAEARPDRPVARTIETTDPRLSASIVAATVKPTPAAYRGVAEEYKDLGVFDKAHQYLSKALLLNSRDPATHDALARLWRDSGFPHLGLSDAHRAVYYAPRSPVVHNTLGTVLQALGRRELARAQYQRALQIDPAASYALTNLCYGWVLDGNAPKAVAACERALQLEPNMTAARNNLALAHAVAGDMPAARAAFEAAGDRAQALYNTGIVDLARGRFTRAATSFEAAYRARPALAVAAARAHQASTHARAAASEE